MIRVLGKHYTAEDYMYVAFILHDGLKSLNFNDDDKEKYSRIIKDIQIARDYCVREASKMYLNNLTELDQLKNALTE